MKNALFTTRLFVLIFLLAAALATYCYAGYAAGEFVTDPRGRVTSFFFPDLQNLHQKRAEFRAPFVNMSVNTNGNKVTAMNVACFEHYTGGAQLVKGTANCNIMVNGIAAMEIRAGENITVGIPHDWSYLQFRKYSTADNTTTRIKARVWLQK